MKLSEAIRVLSEAGNDNARYEARLIFTDICGKKPYELLDGNCESALADAAVYKRASGYPLQYIIGKVGFFKEEYEVTEDCLIPRSDTEVLVEYAVSHIPCGENFVDLCTGSGCIAISTLKNTKNTTAVAVDISERALQIAERNARHNGVVARLTTMRCDVLNDPPVTDSCFALLANPPYVRDEDYRGLQKEISYEPKIAFVAGDDGLEFYKRIIPAYKDKIKKGGFFAFEIGYDQSDAIKEIAARHGLCAKIIKDYSGNDRVAVIEM